MKIVVDGNRCQNHGQCVISAPSNFELNPDGVLEYRASFDKNVFEDIEDAMDVCPVQAISLERDE